MQTGDSELHLGLSVHVWIVRVLLLDQEGVD